MSDRYDYEQSRGNEKSMHGIPFWTTLQVDGSAACRASIAARDTILTREKHEILSPAGTVPWRAANGIVGKVALAAILECGGIWITAFQRATRFVKPLFYGSLGRRSLRNDEVLADRPPS
jgi:hypothetical protein